MDAQAWMLKDGFGLDNLVLVEKELPEPGHKEVRLRMAAASLNYRDLVVLDGQHGSNVTTPLIPISDGCGVVEAVGSDVLDFKPGDRVCPLFFGNWFAGEPPADLHAHMLGGPLDGVLTTHFVIGEQSVVKAPENLSDLEAATLPCAGLTAWSALAESEPIRTGDTVVILGTGGVALFALQFAAVMGARTIVLTSDDCKRERLAELGADEVINYQSEPEWYKTIKRLTNGVGCDRVIELGGAATLEKSLRAVRIGGTIIAIGNVTGSLAQIPLPLLLTRQIRLQAVSVGHRQGFERMNAAIEHNGITPVIDRFFAFNDTPKAYEHMKSGQHMGKICISVT